MRQFDAVYTNPTEGKECDNLVAIVGHLYNFQVVHSVLIFDILKLLIGAFTEKDVELVLFMLRNVGFALRKDDPLALKELIAEGQRKANDMGLKFQDQTRVRQQRIHFYLNYFVYSTFLIHYNLCKISSINLYTHVFSGALHAGNHAGSEEQ